MGRLSLQSLELLVGICLVLVVLYDVFQSVVVPRWTSRALRISPTLIVWSWGVWRAVGIRIPQVRRREGFFGAFAPLVLILILIAWSGTLLLGYGLILFALRDQIEPRIRDLGTALYLAGTSLFTLGFGDLVARGGAARVMVLLAAATGVALMAMVISLIFSLHAAFQSRETPVLSLDGRAGSPPSGVTLLETYARMEMLDDLPVFFTRWEEWAADIIQSHRAYPVLRYFRAHHENESWVAALGAVLDAATLLMSTVDGGPYGTAEMMFRLGVHAVTGVDYRFDPDRVRDPLLSREHWERAREHLAEAGYPLRDPDQSWREFSRLRAQYAGKLRYLARYFAVPAPRWIGDHTNLSHAYGGLQGSTSAAVMPAIRCPHLAEVKEVSPRTHGCEECLKTGMRWVHLRMCRICGTVGCCDSSRGKHATAHFHETGHPVMQSIEPGESWGWCYVDEVMLDLG